MRLGEGVEWALHCATVLAPLPPDVTLPGSRLAEFHDVPPAYLAKTLQALSRAGIVESASGRRCIPMLRSRAPRGSRRWCDEGVRRRVDRRAGPAGGAAAGGGRS